MPSSSWHLHRAESQPALPRDGGRVPALPKSAKSLHRKRHAALRRRALRSRKPGAGDESTGSPTGGAAIRLGVDAVSGPATQRIAECLAPGSTVACYGSMSGQRAELDFYLMFRNDIRLLGVSFARQFATRRTPEGVRQMYARLARLMGSGELVAKIAGVYRIGQILDACTRAGLTGADRDGKVIIDLR